MLSYYEKILVIARNVATKQQFVRPSKEFTTPFGKDGFVLFNKAGGSFYGSFESANLQWIYKATSREELQVIREAFQTVEYLTP